MRTKKSHKDKSAHGNKTKDRLASAKSEDEAILNHELEEAIQEIKHLPEEEFNKAFEQFLVS